VRTVEDIALDARLLHLALLATGMDAALASRTPARACFALLLRLLHVALEDELLLPTIVHIRSLALGRGLRLHLLLYGVRAEVARLVAELGVRADAVLAAVVIQVLQLARRHWVH